MTVVVFFTELNDLDLLPSYCASDSAFSMSSSLALLNEFRAESESFVWLEEVSM